MKKFDTDLEKIIIHFEGHDSHEVISENSDNHTVVIIACLLIAIS